MPSTPIDGFTVEHDADTVTVTLTLTARSGDGDRFTLDALDAARVGHVLLAHALIAMGEARILDTD